MLHGFDVYIRKVVEDGKVIFPEAFCLTEAQRIEALELGRKLESIERLRQTNQAKFYGQYLNDPLDEANLEFKRAWFHKFSLTPELASDLAQIPALMSIDPAYTLSKSSDYTGIVITKTLTNNSVYVMEAKGIKANLKMLCDEVFHLVNTFKPYKVLVEAGNQVVVAQTLRDEMYRRNVFFVLEEVMPEGNEKKTARIRGLVQHYANGRIFHAPHLFDLEEQLIEFPKGAHDDIIDALAYQARYWKPQFDGAPPQEIPHGSYAWWHKKISKRPSVMGKLFNDFKR